jgi:hypothetical protein
MINQKRLIRIETAITPKQAVLLWLRQEYQGKTSADYARWLIGRPFMEAPRIRVGRQVVGAIREAMKGQDCVRIQRAARQGRMETDFLILLVLRVNNAILDHSHTRWLQLALLFEQYRNADLWDSERTNDWGVRIREFATELFSIQAASELIRDRYFDGAFILARDATEDLEQQIMIMNHFRPIFDRALVEAGNPELVTDSDNFRNIVNEEASKNAGYIVALARSRTLSDFGEGEAGNAVLKPYVLDGR